MADDKVEIGVVVKRDAAAANDAKKDVENIGNAAEQAGAKAKQASFDFKEFAKNAGIGAASVITAAGGIAAAAVKSAGQFEQSQIAFKTLLGDSKKATDAIHEIENMAKATPFNLPDLIKANQLLISAGVSSDKARDDIRNLGDAISATGGGTPELMRLSANLQQIKAVGKATAMDIRQFGMAGIDIYTMLADTMGLSVDQVKDMDIGYTQLSEAFAKAAGEGGRFHNAMQDQSASLQGIISNVQDAIGIGLKDLAVNSGLFDVVKKGAQGLLDGISNLIPKLTEFFQWVGSNNTALSVLGGILLGLAAAVFVGFLAAFGPIILATIAFAGAGALVGLTLSALWPTIQTVTKFLQEHHAVLAGLAAFIGVLFIPVLATLIKNMVLYAVTMVSKVIVAAAAVVAAHLPLILIAAAVALAVGLLAKAWESNWHNIRYNAESAINWIIGKINSLIDAINTLGLISIGPYKLFDIPKIPAVSINGLGGSTSTGPAPGEPGFIGPVQNGGASSTSFSSIIAQAQSYKSLIPNVTNFGQTASPELVNYSALLQQAQSSGAVPQQSIVQNNTINTPVDYTQMFRDLAAAAATK